MSWAVFLAVMAWIAAVWWVGTWAWREISRQRLERRERKFFEGLDW